MKSAAVVAATIVLLAAGCASTPPAEVNAVRLYTVDNQEILVRDLKVWEKNFQVESRRFRPRWRHSLERIPIDFDRIAAAETIAPGLARVYFRSGGWDDFEGLFVDEYTFRGWTEYGPFEIDASLINGLVFLDDRLRPVPGDLEEVSPVVIPPEYLDRLVTFEGDVISGEIIDGEYLIKTDYGRLTLSQDKLAMILVDREGDSLLQVAHLKNGDVIRGWIEPGRVWMRIQEDQEISLEFDQLHRVLFRRPVAVDAGY